MVGKWLVEQLTVTGEGKIPDPYGFIHSHRRYGSWADLNKQFGIPGTPQPVAGSERSPFNRREMPYQRAFTGLATRTGHGTAVS